MKNVFKFNFKLGISEKRVRFKGEKKQGNKRSEKEVEILRKRRNKEFKVRIKEFKI